MLNKLQDNLPATPWTSLAFASTPDTQTSSSSSNAQARLYRRAVHGAAVCAWGVALVCSVALVTTWLLLIHIKATATRHKRPSQDWGH